jgi:hypothetical protein
MGVAIGSARWSYAGFNHFRTKLAALEGIKLDSMAGFEGDIPWDTVSTAIAPLLNHSDCDGSLTPDECAQVAPRLAELLPRLKDDYDRHNGAALVASMRAAAASDEPLEFR